MEDDDPRVLEWERRGTVPLLVASALFLTAYAVQVLVPHLSPAQSVLWWTVTVVTWAAFFVDYLVRLALSGNRRRFAARHPLDLVVIALPLLRPLRMVALYDRMRVQVHRSRTSLERCRCTVPGPAWRRVS